MGCKSIIILFIVCLTLLAIIGALFQPRFYMQQLHVRKESIVVDLKFKRSSITRLRYNNIKITLYYAYNQSFSVVGYSVIPGFKQSWKITAHREAVVEARGAAWDDALRLISQGSTVGLRAELTTKYKTVGKGSLCSFCKKAARVAAELCLDSSGVLSKKPIRLH